MQGSGGAIESLQHDTASQQQQLATAHARGKELECKLQDATEQLEKETRLVSAEKERATKDAAAAENNASELKAQVTKLETRIDELERQYADLKETSGQRIDELEKENEVLKEKRNKMAGIKQQREGLVLVAAQAAAVTSDQSGVSTADEKAKGDKKEINQNIVQSLTMVLDHGFVGRVMGAGGSLIKGVRASTHCDIIVSDSFHPIVSRGRKITITGKRNNIADAVEAIYKAAGEEDSTNARRRFTLERDGADFEVPKRTVKKMIGKEGQTIKKTRQETGVKLQFRKGPKETAEEILQCTFEESTSKGGLRSIIETLLIASEPDAGAKRLYERARSESREGEGEDEDGDDGGDDRGGSSSKRPRKRARSEGDGSKDGDAGGDIGDEDRRGGGSKDGRSGHGKSVAASRRGDRHAKNKNGKVKHANKAKTVASTKKARKQQKKDDRKQKGNGGNKGGRATGHSGGECGENKRGKRK